MKESVSSVRMFADEARRLTPASDSLRATIDAWWSSSKGLLRGEELTCDRGGEAEYLDDSPKFPGELHAAFVLATLANCELDLVDPSPALVKV